MNLLTTLAIYFGEYSELPHRMKEEASKIDIEMIQSEKFLCQETVKSLKAFKKKEKK